jgi:hypothetical protein
VDTNTLDEHADFIIREEVSQDGKAAAYYVETQWKKKWPNRVTN